MQATGRMLAVTLLLAASTIALAEQPDEPVATDSEQAVSAPAATPAANMDAGATEPEFVDVVCDRFVYDLKRQDLPYMPPEAVDALRAEMHHYLKLRVKTPPVGPRRTELLEAVDRFVRKKFAGADSYKTFRDHFNRLQWQLWTATARRALTAEELAQRDRQRQWMLTYIRGLPIPDIAQKRPELQAEGRIRVLENEVFGNPLSPFFDEPMSAEEFEAFKKQLEVPSTYALAASPSMIFIAGVLARRNTLLHRWPPGFQHHESGGMSCGGTEDISFGNGLMRLGALVVGPTKNGAREYLDLVTGQTIKPPDGLDAGQPPVSQAENKKGDIWYDAAARRLMPAHGTKMTTLKELDWYAIDQIPLAELRKRLRETPLGESPAIPEFAKPYSREAFAAARAVPTMVFETAGGNVVAVRMLQYIDDGRFYLETSERPLPPYPPFHPADEGYWQTQYAYSPIETAAMLSDRFVRALEKQKLPFVGPKELDALRTELSDYLEVRIDRPTRGTTHKAIQQAIDDFVARNFAGSDCYLHFRRRFEALKWRLWAGSERRNLSIAEGERLTAQRTWTRDYIRHLPFFLETDGSSLPPRSEKSDNQLASDLFDYPLSPFFHDPMSAEEFEEFKARLMKDKDLESAAARIFPTVARVRMPALEKRWPPGFPVGGLHVRGPLDFDFRSPIDSGLRWRSGPAAGGGRMYLDVGSNGSLEQPAGLDETASEAWLLAEKQGDLWFDAKARRLVAVRGARLATLDATEWYAVDRVPLAELRKRVAESPRASYRLSDWPGVGNREPSISDQILRALAARGLEARPTLILETAEGKVALLRVEQDEGASVLVRVRVRPLAAYPPFQPGDEAAAQ